MRYYLAAFKNYTKTTGRATRKEYWLFTLFHYLFAVLFSFIDAFFELYPTIVMEHYAYSFNYGYLTLAYLLISFSPSLCIQVRRLHDVGKSGSWWWISNIPILSLYLFYLNCKASDPSINAYGSPSNYTPVFVHEYDELTGDPCKIKFCRKCGCELANDSEFCSQCSEKIEKTPPVFKLNNVEIKTRKMKFCSRCGFLIDNETKKCTGCGKQYFKGIHFNKIFFIVFAFSLALLIAMSYIVYQHETIDMLNYMETSLQEKVNDLEAENIDIYIELSVVRDELAFFRNFAEIVPSDGSNTYHKYGCSKIDTSKKFRIFNSAFVESNGYKKCKNCH